MLTVAYPMVKYKNPYTVAEPDILQAAIEIEKQCLMKVMLKNLRIFLRPSFGIYFKLIKNMSHALTCS